MDLIFDQPGGKKLRPLAVKLKRWNVKTSRIIINQSLMYTWQVVPIMPVLKPGVKERK